MPGATVCVECFADDFLRDLIGREGSPSGDEDECYFCGAVGERCLPAEKLARRFDVVVQSVLKADPDMEFTAQEGTGETIVCARRLVDAVQRQVGDGPRAGVQEARRAMAWWQYGGMA